MLVVSIVLAGFMFIVGSFYVSFYDFFKKDVETVSQISSENIYARINNLIDVPTSVAITMAHDILLKDIISHENNDAVHKSFLKDMQDYLAEYQRIYDYDSVFFVSAKTNNYYHYSNGLDRILHENETEDIWYFNFLQGSNDYELNVDNDEAHNDEITVFINCKMRDEKGNVIGIIGMGLSTPYVQDFIVASEEKHNVHAYLIKNDGSLLLSSHYTKFDNINVFTDEKFLGIASLLNENNLATVESSWYNRNHVEGYVVTKYIPKLDWYLVIEKNTDDFKEEMVQQLILTIFVSLFAVLLIVVIINKLLLKHDAELMYHSHMDSLTKARNYNAYINELARYSKKRIEFQSFALGVVDINGFKHVNDEHGHMAGNVMLKDLAALICSVFSHNPVFRIGGDEFAVFFTNTDEREIMKLWKMLECEIVVYNESHDIPISLAYGHAFLGENGCDCVEKVFQAADKKMYAKKWEQHGHQ